MSHGSPSPFRNVYEAETFLLQAQRAADMQSTKNRTKPLSCTDPQAVAAMRRIDHWANHKPFDYPTFQHSVEVEAPFVLVRLLATGHQYHVEAFEIVHQYPEVLDMPLECFDRLRKLIHFEYTTEGGEEARV